MLVCIDTHVMIWGVQKVARSSQQEMIERTANFLRWLESEKHAVILPAPVLGEFLMQIPEAEHPEILGELESRFMVAPYDAAAASMDARIWQNNRRDLAASTSASRQKVKTDRMIVAIAVSNRAKLLYSEDPGIRALAKGFIETRDIPRIPQQLALRPRLTDEA